jgi:hypothetical protein
MTVFCLFDTFGDKEADHGELVGVVDNRIAAMSFVGEQYHDPPTKVTRYFEEMDVTDRYIRQ